MSDVLLGNPLVEQEIKAEEGTTSGKMRSLILHNDDYHTFDYVIDALVDVCKHDLVQAEQCTFIVHFNGKCDVKSGTFQQLKPMKDALIARELNATID